MSVSLSPLYVICDAEVCAGAGWPLADFASACLDGGATFLQIRAKGWSGQALLDTTAAVVELARRAHAIVIVNDRADIARMAGAAGVHVGQDDLSARAVRDIVGADALVGLSTHTEMQWASAVAEPVSYVAVGPVFGTQSKETGYEPLGLDLVSRAAACTASRNLPLVAIGGITLGRARAVVAAGARSVAVISDLLATNDPTGRVRQFLHELT